MKYAQSAMLLVEVKNEFIVHSALIELRNEVICFSTSQHLQTHKVSYSAPTSIIEIVTRISYANEVSTPKTKAPKSDLGKQRLIFFHS